MAKKKKATPAKQGKKEALLISGIIALILGILMLIPATREAWFNLHNVAAVLLILLGLKRIFM